MDGSPGHLRVLPAVVTRNGYGSQIASLQLPIVVSIFDAKGYNAIFIRSPRIEKLDKAVQAYAFRDKNPLFVRHNNIMATTFHPELNDDDLFHQLFLSL